MTYAVRMDMTVNEAEGISEILPRCPADVRDRLHDQLWLMSMLVEQRKHTNRNERDRFDQRANKILAALDPGEGGTMPSDTHGTESGAAERVG